MFAWIGGWIWVLFAAPACVGLATVLWRATRGYLLLIEARRHLGSRGVRFIVVYSASPHWQRHVLDNWLPRFGARAVSINWSERARWRSTLEVRLFDHFVKAPLNFNPAVLVLRGLKRPLVYRFYYAFQHAKHGRTDYLERLERDLFEHLAN